MTGSLLEQPASAGRSARVAAAAGGTRDFKRFSFWDVRDCLEKGLLAEAILSIKQDRISFRHFPPRGFSMGNWGNG
jgi:hypothetical protein